MTYEQAKQLKQEINDLCDVASDELNALVAPHKGAMGLTSDAFRTTAEYKAAKAKFDLSFAKARNINGWFAKTFKKEIKAAQKAKYAAMTRIPV